MPVKVSPDAVVRIGDIGVLRPSFKDPEGLARINGRPAIALEVPKRTGENIIETIEEVRAVVERVRRTEKRATPSCVAPDGETGRWTRFILLVPLVLKGKSLFKSKYTCRSRRR